MFDWGCVALAGGLAAALVADLALTALAQPLDRARTALASEN